MFCVFVWRRTVHVYMIRDICFTHIYYVKLILLLSTLTFLHTCSFAFNRHFGEELDLKM